MKRPLSKTIDRPCPHCGQPYSTVNGRYLCWLRVQAGLSQREFGRRIRATSPHISDWERNRRDVPERVVSAYYALRKRS